ncbi:hypothetical protein AB2B38_003630 [Balneola sp. MJW-20]|uniref:hypothetical protein n=1 Tax=Gracilimonas aurantiaca TaxID=3234185 RepID=UPI0034658087
MKHFLIYTAAFIVCTVIGTISHEYGHILAARSLGYETTLHFSSMEWDDDELVLKLHDIYSRNENAITRDLEFEEKAMYEELLVEYRRDNLLIQLGGPVQTMLTGSLGLFILFFYKRNGGTEDLNYIGWLGVFLSLFWLRQVFNLFAGIANGIISPDRGFFGGDEAYISEMLELWPGTLPVISGIAGSVICGHVLFRIIPVKQRPVFISAGCTGGILGYILWMFYLGPAVLP